MRLADGLVSVHHHSQKIEKAIKFIGPVHGNKVLDTSTIQPVAYAMPT